MSKANAAKQGRILQREAEQFRDEAAARVILYTEALKALPDTPENASERKGMSDQLDAATQAQAVWAKRATTYAAAAGELEK